jgi:hypothetical protein
MWRYTFTTGFALFGKTLLSKRRPDRRRRRAPAAESAESAERPAAVRERAFRRGDRRDTQGTAAIAANARHRHASSSRQYGDCFGRSDVHHLLSKRGTLRRVPA